MGLLFTVGFFALIVVAVVAAGYFLVRWTKNTSLGRAFANTKIGKVGHLLPRAAHSICALTPTNTFSLRGTGPGSSR